MESIVKKFLDSVWRIFRETLVFKQCLELLLGHNPVITKTLVLFWVILFDGSSKIFICLERLKGIYWLDKMATRGCPGHCKAKDGKGYVFYQSTLWYYLVINSWSDVSLGSVAVAQEDIYMFVEPNQTQKFKLHQCSVRQFCVDLC